MTCSIMQQHFRQSSILHRSRNTALCGQRGIDSSKEGTRDGLDLERRSSEAVSIVKISRKYHLQLGHDVEDESELPREELLSTVLNEDLDLAMRENDIDSESSRAYL